MVDLPSYSDSDDDTARGSIPEYPGMPRWVKISGIIALVLVLLVGIMLVTGLGGSHGPGRHVLPVEHGVQQP